MAVEEMADHPRNSIVNYCLCGDLFHRDPQENSTSTILFVIIYVPIDPIISSDGSASIIEWVAA